MPLPTIEEAEVEVEEQRQLEPCVLERGVDMSRKELLC